MNWSTPKPVHRRVAALVVAAMVASACVQPDAPGVQVRMLAADLAFGVPEEKPVASAPANTALAGVQLPPGQQAPALPTLPPPPELADPPAPPPAIPPSADLCLPAAPNEFPDVAAARNVGPKMRPAEGVYLWRGDGKRAGPDTLGIKIPVIAIQKREVRNVVEVSPTHFTFDTVQRDIVNNQTVVTSWQVRSDGVAVNGDDLPAQPPPVLGSELPVPSAGPPDRGIAITAIKRFDRAGEPAGEFTPVSPLLLLPLPVVVNEEFQSAAVDPVNFQSVTFTGRVRPIVRVDACGEMAEGWKVTGSQQVNDGENSAVTDREFVFAPQFGGILLREKVHQDAGAILLDVDFTINQLTPDPLPKKQD